MVQPNHFYFKLGNYIFFARPIETSDKEMMIEGFGKLSNQSKYLRFFTLQKNLSTNDLKYLTEVDGLNHIAWIINDVTNIKPKGIAVGRAIRIKNTSTAEVAITVIDEYQQIGIGSVIFSILNILAAKNDIKIFRYNVLHHNKFVVNVLEELGILEESYDNEIIKINSLVRASYRDIPDKAVLQKFVTTMKNVENKMFS